MECEVNPAENSLRIRFDTSELAERFLDSVSTDQGFLVRLTQGLKLYQQLSVRAGVEGHADMEFEVDVAQVFDKGQDRFDTAFLVRRWEEARFATWKRSTASPGQSDSHHGEITGSSPIHQIRAMNPNQKSRLAVHASKTERQILLRENSPQILQALMLNPRVEIKDVLQVVKSTHSDAGLLKRIAGDQRWNKNPEIQVSLVKNLRTPPEIAIRLVPSLRTSDLRFLSKMASGVRETLRKAALNEYLSRSGTR